MIPEPTLMERIPAAERFSSERLVEDLIKNRLNAYCFLNTDRLLDALLKKVQAGDVVLIMSNGGFDDIHQRLLQQL